MAKPTTKAGEYFQNFFDEKVIKQQDFEIVHKGNTHFIDTDFVIELIKKTKGDEAKKIRDILVKIDFANGNVNHFLEHLANGFVKSNY